MNVRDLGVMEYGKCWQLQKDLVNERMENRVGDTILVVEHPSVITLGRRGRREDVFTTALPIFEVERGGEATYHGPGQLIVYPITRLPEWPADLRKFVWKLEEAVIKTLASYGLTAQRLERQRGVWIRDKKIASIGIAVQRNVTYHGLALNVNTDLSNFQLLRPCGSDGSIMTSMQAELGQTVSMAGVKEGLLTHLTTLLARGQQSEVPETQPSLL